jgi:hypothetical protein
MNLKERKGHREIPWVSTWIKNQRKELRALRELRGNPFFSRTRKKLVQ